MNASRCALVTAIVLLPMSAAERSDSKDEKVEVVMPVMKVPSTRVERFGLMNRRLVGQDGHETVRLLIWQVPTKADMFKMLVGGAQVADEIVSIDGQDVADIPRHERQGMLGGYFKIVVKRQVGRRSFKLLELDGRGD